MRCETLTVGAIGTNCHLIWRDGGQTCAVLDPGDKKARVLERISELGLTLEAVLLTHGHYDHTDGVAALKAAFPALSVYMHPGDFGENDRLLFPPPDGWQRLADGDVLSVAGLTIHVLHTPGHSLGSVTYQCGGCLFTGDTLFQGTMGRTDFAGGSEVQIMRSLARLGRLEGDYRVLPGHMGLTTLDAERRSNPYLREALGG